MSLVLSRVSETVDWCICFNRKIQHGGHWERSRSQGPKHIHNFDSATCKKWNESGFRPPLCTYGLNWARRTSWGWWDDWDDTVLQTQDSKFEPWRSEAEHATSQSRRLPTILTFTRGWGRNILVSFKPPVRPVSWACGHVTEILLILQNLFLTWLFEGKS